jgi:hypothetical protein
MNISTATPAEIDAEIARLNGEIAQQDAIIEKTFDAIARYQRLDATYYVEAIAKAKVARQAAHAALPALLAELAPLDREYDSRGGWTRYFLVEGGHLHYDVSASRCSRINTTSHYWLTEYSGTPAEAMIELAGERVCTVCFPDAPVAAQDRPSQLFTKSEAEKEEARREREAKRQADAKKKADKAITAPNGDVLVDRRGEKVYTEARAQALYRDAVADLINLRSEQYRLFRGKNQSEQEFNERNEERAADVTRQAETMLAALAAKHGVKIEDERAAHAKPVATKARKDLKESLAWRRGNLSLYAIQDEA